MESLLRPPSWFAPATLAAIAILAGMTISYGKTSPVAHWSGRQMWIAYTVLLFIDVNALISARFRVVAIAFRIAQRAFAAGDRVVAAKRVRGGAGVAYAYCIASATYGLILAVVTGHIMVPLTFSVFAVLMFAVLHPYVNRSVADLHRRLTTAAEP